LIGSDPDCTPGHLSEGSVVDWSDDDHKDQDNHYFTEVIEQSGNILGTDVEVPDTHSSCRCSNYCTWDCAWPKSRVIISRHKWYYITYNDVPLGNCCSFIHCLHLYKHKNNLVVDSLI